MMVKQAQKAKMKVKIAATSAIRKAVRNAAILATAQKKKEAAMAAKERAGKDVGSANTLAVQAQTAAEERMAKKEVRKAKREMARVKTEKRKALKRVKRVVKKDAKKYARHSKYAVQAKKEKRVISKDARKIARLKHQLKESQAGSTAETLLASMYQPIPYEKTCGSLAKDPKKITETAAQSRGQCAAKCAADAKCKSFQFSKRLCVLSAKAILRPGKYGQMLACPQKNVLVKASMKLADVPSVFQKKEQQKKDAELGESFSYAKLAAMDLDSELNDDSDDEKNVAESADQEPASRCMADLRLARLQIKNLAAAAKTPKTSLPAAKLKAKADAKEMEAAKDKAIAVQALKKSVQVGATQDKIMKTSMTLAKKVGKEQAQLLKVEKKAAKRKKDRQKMQGKMATLAADEATKRAKMKSRMGKLETLDIQETGAAAASKMKAQDLREEHKMVINAAENMAVGLRMKIKRINGLKKVLSLEQNKYGKLMKKHQKLMKVSKKKSNQVTACQKSSADKLRKAATKYKSSLDKHKLKMQSVQTQASLAKRALQLCEKKSQGSNARAMNRVARRENRAVQRAKKTMNKSKDKKELKKQLAVKVKAQMKKKMRKVEAKMVAKKVAKVTKKSVSQKCKACLKLSAEEKRVLSVDCNAC